MICYLPKNLLHNSSKECYPIPLFWWWKFGHECPSSGAIFSKISKIHLCHQNVSWFTHDVALEKQQYRSVFPRKTSNISCRYNVIKRSRHLFSFSIRFCYISQLGYPLSTSKKNKFTMSKFSNLLRKFQGVTCSDMAYRSREMNVYAFLYPCFEKAENISYFPKYHKSPL